MVEGFCIGFMFIDGGFVDLVLLGILSYYCIVER